MNKKVIQYIDKYGIDSLPHLELASANKCDIFLTTNRAMLKDRKELEKIFNIKIRTPKEINENAEV